MKSRFRILTTLFMGLLPMLADAQGFGPKGKGVRRAEMAELKVNQVEAPVGFEVARAGMARGKVEAVEFVAKQGGAYRAMIYMPPGLAAQKKLPVLYLLHGASGDENTWIKDIHADAIFDNLYAEKKLVPMLVVMPSMLSVSGRALAGESREAKARASLAFGEVLLNDLMPFIEARYPVWVEREQRAVAGLSMGAGVALSMGLMRSDRFAWVGAFSGAGRRWSVPKEKLRLLWLSVGDGDGMMAGGMVAADAFFTAQGIPHEFHVSVGGHEPSVWMKDLYFFAPVLFRLK